MEAGHIKPWHEGLPKLARDGTNNSARCGMAFALELPIFLIFAALWAAYPKLKKSTPLAKRFGLVESNLPFSSK